MSGQLLNLLQNDRGMIFNKEFEDAIRQNKLFDFDMVMNFSDGEIVKHAVKERKTIRFSLHSGSSSLEAYLKRHLPLSFYKLCSHLLKLSKPRTALDELENIVQFYKAGLPTMVPILAGRRSTGIFRSESFLITKGISRCERLDYFMPRVFFPPLTKEKISQKRSLIKKLAKLTAKMHQAGLNHRDFYLCHILIDTFSTNDWKFFFVDLHRADIRKKVGRRWKIKDLAALNYSAPVPAITRADRIRFLKSYLHDSKLAYVHKAFALEILKKSEKMRFHTINTFTPTVHS